MNLMLDVVPLWAIFFGALGCILLSVEAGYRLGRWRRRLAEQEKESSVGGMVAAELGLLAFLLAFTFGIAASRFEDRRQVLLNEANAIGTTYLRAAMLPEPHRAEIRRLLREYVDQRLAGAQPGALAPAIKRSEELQVQLWDQATAIAQADPHSIIAGLFVQTLNEMIDLHAVRLQAAVRSRVPVTVWGVLFVVTILSFGAMGYHAGLSGTIRSPAVLVVALGFATVFWLVVDLERPQQGLLRVSQQPMIDLKNSMGPPN
jgi:hypothetical protein